MREKFSYYTNVVEKDNMVLLYNALTNSFLILSNKIFQQINTHKSDIYELKRLNERLYQTLKDNGFVVDEDFNEQQYVNNKRLLNIFRGSEYFLIINPCMDCNLKCWYCYENHIANSMMSFETAEKIIKHIKLQFRTTNFKRIYLSFFGGEPLLNKKVIRVIIEKTKNFALENNIGMGISFTTNGTLFSDSFIDFLSEFNVKFQITLDGDKELHNKTRFYKTSYKGSYEHILQNLKKITDIIENASISLRINFKEDTLDSIKNLIPDILGIEKKEKIWISLHKVWQVDEKEIDVEKILNTLSYINSFGIKANFPLLDITSPCYADLFYQATINYNGYVYKCTARDFNLENSLGKLLDNGMIEWNIEKRLDYHNKTIKNNCKVCTLLPVCSGMCIQSCSENSESICKFEYSKFTKEDFIVYNFNQAYQIN